MPTFGINIIIILLCRSRGACPHRGMRTCPTYCSAMLLCIMVDHELLNVDNYFDSLIKYAIYLSILAIPA